MDGEDPGLLDLIKEISRVLDGKDKNKPEFVRLLLTSSPYWSEDQLSSIHHLRAPYLANLLQDANLLHIGGRSSHDVLIDYYRQVNEEIAKHWSNGTVRSRYSVSNGARDKSESKKIPKEIQSPSTSRFVTMETGRFDHRGMPIKERRFIPSALHDEKSPPEPETT